MKLHSQDGDHVFKMEQKLPVTVSDLVDILDIMLEAPFWARDYNIEAARIRLRQLKKRLI